MRGSSLVSLESIERRFDEALSSLDAQRAVAIGQELFSVVDLLDSTSALQRALTDPARQDSAKRQLVVDLLGQRAAEQTVEVVAQASASRWSQPADFVAALEQLGADAVLAGAELAGKLDEVGAQLWQASQVVADAPELRAALSDRRANREAKQQLIESLFANKVDAETLVLLTRAATAPRGAHVVPAIQRYSDLVARRRDRIAARVIVSAPLSAAQISRIESLLRDAYGKDIQVDVIVDPDVIGGIRIQVGSDVIDSTVLARLVDVRRKIAS